MKNDYILFEGRKKLETYLSVIGDMEKGLSEASACRKHNVDLMKFRNFIRSDYKDKFKELECKKDEEYVWDLYSDFLTWQDALYCTIIGNKSTTAPEDFDEAYEYIKTHYLNSRESDILDMRYKEGMTFAEIGEYFGVTCNRIREIERRIIRKLRSNRHTRNILYYGMDYVNSFEEAIERVNSVKVMPKKDIDVMDLKISELDLSYRVYSSLRRGGLNTVRDVVDFSRVKGLKKNLRSFGEACYKELYGVLSERLGIVLNE